MFIAYNIIYFHFFVNENEITDFIEPAFLILSKRKKPLAVFIINTCLYEKSLLYTTCRGKKILPVVEKLLRDGTCRGKTKISFVFRIPEITDWTFWKTFCNHRVDILENFLQSPTGHFEILKVFFFVYGVIIS